MPAIDKFKEYGSAPLGRIQGGASEITPSDTEDLEFVPRTIQVGTAGDVSCIMVDGSEVVWPALHPGVLYPYGATRVKATGTTATRITVGW